MRGAGSARRGPLATAAGAALVLLAGAGLALASSGESGGGGVTVIPNESVIIQIVNFILLIVVLNLIVYRPIRGILHQRKEKFKALALSIEAAQRDAQERERAFAQGVKDARARGMQERDALLKEAEAEEKRILEKLHAKAQAELAEFRTKVAADAEKVRQALQQQVDGFARAISQKILGRSVQ